MTTEIEPRTADDMRRAFDRTFALPSSAARPDTEDFLAIRASEHLLALRAGEIRAVLRCPPITLLPARSVYLQGISAVRDAIVGMYSLSGLIGGSKAGASGSWVALCAGGSVGLVFDELQGYVRMERREISRGDDAGKARIAGFASEVVLVGGLPRPVISVLDLLARINAISETPEL